MEGGGNKDDLITCRKMPIFVTKEPQTHVEYFYTSALLGSHFQSCKGEFPKYKMI